MTEKNIFNNSILNQGFNSVKERYAEKQEKIEHNKQLKDEIYSKKLHLCEVNIYTSGAKKTGLEDISTKDLYKKFHIIKNNLIYNKKHNKRYYSYGGDVSKMKHVVAEISNRVLKKLKTPSVKVLGIDDKFGDSIAEVANYLRPLDKQWLNTTIQFNLHNIDVLTPFEIFHECKHLSQKYTLHNFIRGFKTNEYELINGIATYLYLSAKEILPEEYFSYEQSLNELDANMFAYNLFKRSYENGLFDNLSKVIQEKYALNNYFNAYYILKNNKVINGEIDINLQKQFIKSLKKGIEDIKNSKMFTTKQVEQLENLNFDNYFKALNKRLAEIENDFKIATIDYQKKYGVKIINNNTINETDMCNAIEIINEKLNQQYREDLEM